jgi:inhibitor of cysteine peptidase
MVQKEVAKKTKIYSTVAVLFAIILVSMIFIFGSSPSLNSTGNNSGTTPVNQTPGPNNQGISPNFDLATSGMKTFKSIGQLEAYVGNTTGQSYSYYGGPLDSKFFGTTPTVAVHETSSTGATYNSASAPVAAPAFGGNDYSTTNIQVAGVDEADIVKTDGQYIYAASTSQNQIYALRASSSQTPQSINSVYILKADPQNPSVISKIVLGDDTQPAGLFLSADGNKLVVVASRYSFLSGGTIMPGAMTLGAPMLPYYQANVYTYIHVYDVSNKAIPVLTRNFTVSGSYFNSRMIGNYVYAVVSQPAVLYNNAVALPAVYNGNSYIDIAPTSIYYTSIVQPSYYSFTSFFGIDILNDTTQPSNLTITMGDASSMYVSQNNIYLTNPTWTNNGETSSIYRVAIDGAQLTFQAEGNVAGNTINQYSMDENGAYFRIATNSYNTVSMNNIYVLNATDLTITGKLEGISQGENLYAARFIGDRCYLVTFKQTDPFFIVDLSNPSAPRVAGELKIPGYSSFLQPYDENHVIGFGMVSQIANGMENQTLKLALFDVSNVNNPTQVATYTVQGSYTSSAALYDPKAILFNLQKQLLVIPVSISNYQTTYTFPNGTVTPNMPTISSPTIGKDVGSYPIAMSYTNEYWQGAYVFNLTPNNGFTLRGTITHLDATQFDSNGFLNQTSTYYSTQNNEISRALYISNTLYTFSNNEVKLNSLTDLVQTAAINLT